MKLLNYLLGLLFSREEILPQASYKASAESVALIETTMQQYKRNNRIAVPVSEALAILSAFETLHAHLIDPPADEDHYFQSNLCSMTEQDAEQNTQESTLSRQLARTKQRIQASPAITGGECQYYLRNVEVLVRDEAFTSPPEKLIAHELHLFAVAGGCNE